MHIFLSPHFDDAAGSCGGLIGKLAFRGEKVLVLTIFGGLPWRRPWKIPKVIRRRIENRRACRALGVRCENAGFLDGVWRAAYPKKEMLFDGAPLREPELAKEIAARIKSVARADDIVYAPAGLGNHADHRIVAAAAKNLSNKIIHYEEFYYDWLGKQNMPGYRTLFLSERELENKIRAAMKYKTEMRRLFKGLGKAKSYFKDFRTENGTAVERYDELPRAPRVIVSFTSFPFRIPKLHLMVETILNQTVRPDKIVLYLSALQFPTRKLSPELDAMIAAGKLDVRFEPDDIRSYKKLVPAMRDFPDDLIVTVDDDILYPDYTIETLLRSHRKYPNAISGMRVRRIRFGADGNPLTYRKWRLYRLKRVLLFGKFPKYSNLPTTGGGTLFPPHSLHPDFSKKEIFTALCPTTDDIWFWAMAALNGTKAAVARRNRDIVEIQEMQSVSLRDDNAHGKLLNDDAVGSLFERYPELKNIVGPGK
ncbi:MAG: PIG-L family deacetylase [Rickettsiales bacterium]|jgi:LmbE family N-acetylglucosaminyl deacetylase|nr:PIG-L family deacetylase [Rickettsiales bacterium]